jgi:hypothetical protein
VLFVKTENFEDFDDKKFPQKGCLVIIGYNVKGINCLCRKTEKTEKTEAIPVNRPVCR